MISYNKVGYETICAAVHGDEDALTIILKRYDGYLNTLSMRKCNDGNKIYSFIDETIKSDLQNKLIIAILKFKI